MKARFRTRVSVLILLFVLVVVGFSGIMSYRGGEIEGVYIVLGTMLFVGLILFGMSYEVTEEKLSIRILGIKYYSIKLGNIVSIQRSYNPLSSPAASLKRLSVKVSGNKLFPYVLISPAREQEFLELIKKKNPNVQIDVPNHQEVWRVWDWDL